MFKRHQKFVSAGFAPIFEEVETRMEDGDVVTTTRNINSVKLPKPELFDFERMLKAGVDLQQVNTKILETDYSPIIEDLNEPSETSNEKENNNEN